MYLPTFYCITKSWENLVYFLFPFCFVIKAQIVLLRQSLPQMNICFGEQILMKIVILQEIFLLSGGKTTVDLCIQHTIHGEMYHHKTTLTFYKKRLEKLHFPFVSKQHFRQKTFKKAVNVVMMHFCKHQCTATLCVSFNTTFLIT